MCPIDLRAGLFGQSVFRPSDNFAYLKTYDVGTQKNCLNETVLLSTQNTMSFLN